VNLVETTDLVFQDWLTYIGTATNFAFGNEDPINSATGKKLDEGSEAWYRISFREAGGGRANLNGEVGTRKYDRLGFLAVQCFSPTNVGEKTGKQMAEAARTYFEDRRLNNDIIYLNATARPQPPDGKWFPVLLEVQVVYTDIK
jgi:hypothetical protein